MDVFGMKEDLAERLSKVEFAGWSVGEIVIGRTKMRNVAVRCRDGAIAMMETIDHLLHATRRRKAGTKLDQRDLSSPFPTRKLSQEIKIYMEKLERRNLSPCFMSNTKHALRMLMCATGDIPTGHIKPNHIGEMWDAMQTWPSRGSQREEFKGMTDPQIVQWGIDHNVPAPAARTLNLRLQLVRAFFKDQMLSDKLKRDPTAGFSKGVSVLGVEKKRRAYTDGEIQAMFDHKRFKPWASKYPHRWWMPMLGLFTGARVNEIAQLKVSDIDQVDGFWVIHIRQSLDEDLVGKSAKFKTRARVKCASSIRSIPIAQELIDAGFLEFVEEMRKRHARLFPHLSHRICPKTGLPDGTGYAPSFKIQFRKYINEFSKAEYLGFHSFRHRFISVMGAKKIPREVIGAITGHIVKDNETNRQSVLDMFYMDPAIREGIVGHPMAEAIAALMQLKPNVKLPRYKKGQFAKALKPGAKLYP